MKRAGSGSWGLRAGEEKMKQQPEKRWREKRGARWLGGAPQELRLEGREGEKGET